jgi:hypothetical protein
LEVILDEAYFMLAAWSELDRQLAYLEVLHGNPDMHAQVHSMEEIRMTAANTNNCLTRKIGESWWAAPNIRKTLRRVEEDGTGKSFLEPIKLLSVSQKFIMNSFSRWKEKPDWIKTPGVMSWTLESIDRLLQCKNMLSTRLLSLLTDVSVLGEVLRQVALWEKPPNIRNATMEHTGCGEQLNETMTGFCEWTWVQGKLTLSLRCVQPFKEALLPGTQAPDTRYCRGNATCRGKPG